MKIYKYLHSCLVFEKDGFKLLVDPGKFSFAEGELSPEDFEDVKAIIITHNHPDHLDKENLEKIIDLSGAPVYTNPQVAGELAKEGLDSLPLNEGSMNIGPFLLEVINVMHEPLLDSPVPQVQALIIDGKVLHPADSFEEKLTGYKNIELLVLPTMAPFTTEIAIAAFADKIKPKQILPVHDGFAKAFFVKQRYELYAAHFKKQAIKFHELYKPGDSITI
jgi:L-ascorbate metabolism protein UlaG (beta-lactamase superfamily)